MKKPIILLLIVLLLLWSVGEASYRAGYQAGNQARLVRTDIVRAPVYKPVHTVPSYLELPPVPDLAPKDQERWVVAAKGEKVFHDSSCQNVRGGEIVRVREAVRRKLTPCLTCFCQAPIPYQPVPPNEVSYPVEQNGRINVNQPTTASGERLVLAAFGMLYHKPNCAEIPRTRVDFVTVSNALKAGYRPCSKCEGRQQ